MRVSIAIMAHPKRAVEAKRLFEKVEKMPFSFKALVFDDGNGEWETGKRSLRQAYMSDWHIVLQDDAIIADSFYTNVVSAIKAAPYECPISFYTGTVKPFSPRVARAATEARTNGASFIEFYRLMWGVGFAMPVDHIEQMLQYVDHRSDLPFDERISLYYDRNKLPVLYTNPSIVDHDYKLDSIANSGYSGEPRKARNYTSDSVANWNNKTVLMW